ncbi:lysophospholipid acyltransferase family protein [Lignipirellula cremea]|uniref:2-acyl-glycerophospho-ethanolamine acyltransferase n=1 Tax=Lignipirellula cremea TaxID=2528010 RepID=A0A518E1D6_9BACT|nr:lysophospholipid acyltransferase family protein [Lignipirellula cremea]QDU97908.1 2-acyl-glycerophospho-ethanolamine acyltransferase [Lignipirellula cremea]
MTDTACHTVEDGLADPEAVLNNDQQAWLPPPRGASVPLGAACCAVAVVAMRTLYRFRVEGRKYLQTPGPVILTPNHSSTLDPPTLAAALGYRFLSNTRWAARRGVVQGNPVREFVARACRMLPVGGASAVAMGAAVLDQGENLIWFPEGTRSHDGQLQELKPGIGYLLRRFNVPALPVDLDGPYAAMPPGNRFPHVLQPMTVRFGRPFYARQVPVASDPAEDAERIAAALQSRMRDLRPDYD